jgi:hypothetical protein
MMARRSRGLRGKCPNFTSVQGGDGERRCIATYKGDRFEVIRYVNGKMVAWHVPSRGPIGGRRLPASTRSTRSLSQLLEDAHAFVSHVRGKNN